MNDKKKVLFVIHQLNIGGAQKAFLAALDAIDYERNEVTIYIRKKRLDFFSQINSNVSKIIINEDRTKYYRRPYAIVLQLIQIACKALGRNDQRITDILQKYIVDSQMRYEKQHYFSDGVIYDTAICYIQGYHALFVSRYIDAKRKILFYHDSVDELHAIHEKVMADYAEIYCVSNEAQREIQNCYPQYAEKISLLENIVNANEIRRKAAEMTSFSQSQSLTFCSCGRMAKVKGFDLAVEAARILKDNGINFKWLFVGDGPERLTVESLVASYCLKDQIIFMGMQKNPYPYIKLCDIYVQPSYEEAQPLSIIEAQILLRPVVSTKTAGGKALIQDGINGILTGINAQSLAEGITRLFNDVPLREAMTGELEKIDYTEKEKRFKEQWSRLLGDD